MSKPQNSQKSFGTSPIWNSKKARKGVGWGLRFKVEYSLFWGPKTGDIGLGLGANPVGFPWTWVWTPYKFC